MIATRLRLASPAVSEVGVAGLVVGEGVALNAGGNGRDVDLSVVHQMRHSHAVAGQGAGLVGADDVHGAEGLDDLQVADQHAQGKHTLGGQGQGDGHLGQQALGHVGHHDADHEYDGLDPGVAVEEGQNEESDAQREGHDSHNVDQAVDLVRHQGRRALDGSGGTGD